MSEYIPDPIERGEARAEIWADEIDLPGGMFRCPGCKTPTSCEDAHPSSPDPYCLPICGACLSILLDAKEQDACNDSS